MPPPPDRGPLPWERLDHLFDGAVALPASERAAFVERHCREAPELRAPLEALIAADAEAETFLARPFGRVVEAAPEGTSCVGWRAGPYRLLRRFAHGGMGDVYLAARCDLAFERLVAVKVIQEGFVGREAGRRFELERRILGELEHPAIARLYDAGELDDGRPYLVMELVEGEPVDRYCVRHRLSVDQRIALFLEICAAVAYAHRHLVVHRDLKPSNILVTPDGRPKLLDFGIAKLLAPDDEGGQGFRTHTGHRPRTPAHAAPEQITGDAVTTATDTYALGLLLYRLLCEGSPFDSPGSLPHELEAAVLSEPPVTPSQRARHGALRRRLRGDLDTILLKALRKEPERRYGSVNELQDDLQRNLDNLPIRARRDTWLYRSRKFLRRHRAGVVGAGAVTLLLTTAVVVASLQGRRAAAERDLAEAARREAMHEQRKSEAVSELLVGIFDATDPFQEPHPDRSIQEVLERAREQARQVEDGTVRASLLHHLGRVHARQGLLAEGEALLTEALRLRRRAGAPPEAVVASTLELADAVLEMRRPAEAEGLLQALLIDHPGAAPLERARAHRILSASAAALGRLEEAAALLDTAIPDLERLGPVAVPEMAQALHDRGLLAFQRAEFERARADFAAAYEVQRNHPEASPFLMLQCQADLATALRYLGRTDEARQLYHRTLERQIELLGENHVRVAMTLNNLGVLEAISGRHLEAARHHCRAAAVRRHLFGPRHELVAKSYNALGYALGQAGDLENAARAIGRSVEIYDQNVDLDRRGSLAALNQQANLLGLLGQHEAADRLFRRAIAESADVFEDGHPYRGDFVAGLAWLELERGRSASAERLALRAEEIFRQKLDGDDPRVLYARLLAVAAGNRRASSGADRSVFGDALPAIASGFPKSTVLRKALVLVGEDARRHGPVPGLEAFADDLASARLIPPAVDYSTLLGKCLSPFEATPIPRQPSSKAPPPAG